MNDAAWNSTTPIRTLLSGAWQCLVLSVLTATGVAIVFGALAVLAGHALAA